MWGALSRLFVKQGSKSKSVDDEDYNDINKTMMDKTDYKKFKEREVETHESRIAKQRATLKWMLLKAFNGKVPENLREPFYKDHEGAEHAKPQVVQLLASAELYCMALSSIYCDPNYASLNHTSVLQALARKGVVLNDPGVTETILIQTTPIKMSAHQTVMQGVMTLYTREVVSPELVAAAVNRFLPGSVIHPPPDHERALLLWINRAIDALRLRARHSPDSQDECAALQELAVASDVSDLCDGTALAALISFYCPEAIRISEITVTSVPTVSDCVHNLTLVSDFCARSLPLDVFLMQPDQVYFMRGSMRHNVVVLLADLFNMLEINPAKCVTLKSATPSSNEGRNSQGVLHKRSLPQAVTGIPDLRPGLDTASTFSGSPIITPTSLRKPLNNDHHNDSRNGDGEFVVHRGRGVTTLSSIMHGDVEPAGKPTNWGDHRKQSFAGRRSRRNSLSEDSQLTLENLCGSEENIHLLGRNPDKAPAVLSGDQIPEAPPRRSLSRANSWIESQRRAEETRSSVGLQQTLLEPSPPPSPAIRSDPHAGAKEYDRERKTTFAAMPNNTTTWQSISSQASSGHHSPTTDNGVNDGGENLVMNSQLINIRLKLEEKRRMIEKEKKRVEARMNRQRQKLGEEVFLQAITKGGSKSANKSPESDPGNETTEHITHAPRPFSLQDISEIEQKWLKEDIFVEEKKTPDIENLDYESYQRSLAQMNSSLNEIQADLKRLDLEQNQISKGGLPPQMQQPPPQQLPPQPQLQSFASLHAQPTYNNINYINNMQPQPPPPVHHQDYNRGGMGQHNMYNNMSPGYQDQGYYGRNNATQPYGQHSPYHQSGFHQQQYQHSTQLPPLPSHQHQNSHYDHRYNNQHDVGHVNNRGQWHQPTPPYHQQSPYENYSPRYGSEGGYGGAGGSSLGSESGYGGSRGGDDASSASGGRRGEFFLHEPSQQQSQPPQRQRWPASPPLPAADQSPPPWLQQRRDTGSLGESPPRGREENGGSEGYRTSPSSLAPPTPPPRSHQQPQPPPDDMEPQSISFIGSAEEESSSPVPALSKLNITSGSRTYRVSSPTKGYVPIASKKISNESREQGFYISFDDESSPKQPARPKPPLRTKRNSPKKERGLTQTLEASTVSQLVSADGREISRRDVNKDMDQDHRRDLGRQEGDVRLPPVVHNLAQARHAPAGEGLVIGNQPDPVTLDEMERKKERIVLLSLQRRQAAEDCRLRKEAEAAARREAEKAKQDERRRKKEEDRRRREAILEQHKIKKAIEEAEREGKQVDKDLIANLKSRLGSGGQSSEPAKVKMRQPAGQPPRPRPKTVHLDGDMPDSGSTLTSAHNKKGSTSNLSAVGGGPPRMMRRDYYRGSQDCLAETRRPQLQYQSSVPFYQYQDAGDDSRGTSPGRTLARRSSYKNPSRDASPDVRRARRGFGAGGGRKSASLMNLASHAPPHHGGSGGCEEDRRGSRAGSPSGPGSLPLRRRGGPGHYDDAASEAGSDYSGPRLYRQPTTKSNKGIIVNAIEYCVFPGMVNKEAKRRVLDEVARAEAKHLLVLFRDAGCQFRALYSYYPETDEVVKLYGTGPKQVTDRMFDKFFKYNSGGKCFAQIHTKHLTVTIDAFTIHNSLWQGKKVNLPNKADMTLVI